VGVANQCATKIGSLFVFSKEMFFFFRLDTKEKEPKRKNQGCVFPATPVLPPAKGGSVVILGGLSLVNSLHAYTFASLKRKKLISTTPLNDALNALILALNASAAAFVLLFTKKFRILS